MSATQGSLDRAVGWLLKNQDAEGWWSGELETNVTMTAEHVLLCTFLGVSLDDIRADATKLILHTQRSDGSWSLYYDGPADLSTTVEAYVALKVLGVDPQRDEMQRALHVIHRAGGLANARVFTKIWMALFGVYPWKGVPSLPPELVFFPLWMPFNLYDFACWARGTVAPLTIVVSKRPVRPLGVDVSEVFLPGTETEATKVRGTGWLMAVEKLQKLYEKLPFQPFRAHAQRKVIEWVIERQELDGSWGGIQPPWVYSLIALDLMGYSLDHPVVRKGLEGMKRFSIRDERGWQFEACMSPVWDTAWIVRALAWAGLDKSHEAMQRAVHWLLKEQIPDNAPGDWREKCDFKEGNGWAFEFDNDAYPDIDDTTIVVLALLEGGHRNDVNDAVQRGTRWTLAMRSKNGAWAAFDRDNTRELLYRMPFSDFGAMIDPPTEDVTAHVLEMLAALGYDDTDPYVQRGIEYLKETQRNDGSWWGRWGVNFIYGTWCVISALQHFTKVDALRASSVEDRERSTVIPSAGARQSQARQSALSAGVEGAHEISAMIARGAQWLLSVQNKDGGWGESCHSYVDESFAGVGKSTASQTAWAVNALQIAGMAQHPAAQRGLAWLCERQLPNGTWDEPECTGTGFPRDFYINYHLYRHVFPTMALAVEAKRTAEVQLAQPAGERSAV